MKFLQDTDFIIIIIVLLHFVATATATSWSSFAEEAEHLQEHWGRDYKEAFTRLGPKLR